MDIIKCFNENKRQQLCDKNQDHYKKWFRRALEQLKLDIQLNLTDKDLALYTYRLSIGYWGIGKGNGIPSGIRSTATQNLKSNQTTNDHLFGVVEVGRYVHQELIKMNEHKSENIARNKHSLDDKKQLKHYKNVSELILA